MRYGQDPPTCVGGVGEDKVPLIKDPNQVPQSVSFNLSEGMMSDKRPMNVWEFLDGIDWFYVLVGLAMLASIIAPVVAPWFKK